MEKQKNILIVAGEASGDMHAAALVNRIKGIRTDIAFFGLGGAGLRKEGVALYYDIVELAVVGFFEVIKTLGTFRRIFRGLLKEVDRLRPELAILVDYPGFNLRLAAELKKRNIPVVYYISPQVWAWGEKRIEFIRRTIARMIVFFKFEEKLYKEHNVAVSFVGHPLLDAVRPACSRQDFLRRMDMDNRCLTVALLPGSREKEVKALLPVMLDSACRLDKKMPGKIQFLILQSANLKEGLFREIIARYPVAVKLAANQTYDGLAASDFALVASGTATLETAILGIPMAVLYKVSWPTWAYIRAKIKIPYIGLVNVVRGEKFIEEFIQYDMQPRKISDYVGGLLADEQRMRQIKAGLSLVAASLGEKGASDRAAGIIAQMLGEK